MTDLCRYRVEAKDVTRITTHFLPPRFGAGDSDVVAFVPVFAAAGFDDLEGDFDSSKAAGLAAAFAAGVVVCVFAATGFAGSCFGVLSFAPFFVPPLGGLAGAS
ncbi:MAG: hypothetical protein Q8M64_14220, partial [Methyloversatilis sp.]|nr:hypothetical protein [Methyloversatilis sp.]